MNPRILKFRRRLGKVLLFLALDVVVLCVADTPIKPVADVRLISTSELEGNQLFGVNLTPADLVAIDLNDTMLSRLRTDPRVQPILQAVRQDLLTVKWQQYAPSNFAWGQYGAKALPLLDYYTQSSDRDRREYGINGIRSLGKPYTTLWLKKQIKRRSHSLLWSSDWVTEFGLDDPKTRREIIQLVRENLDSPTDPNYNKQFNLDILETLKSGDKADPYSQEISLYEQKYKKLSQWWEQQKKLKRLNAQQIQQMLAYYRSLSSNNKSIIKGEAVNAKRGQLSSAGRALLQSLMNDEKLSDQGWATVMLDYNGVAEASQKIEEVLNGDLRQLNSFTLHSNGAATLSLLVGIAKKYPNSRFIQGCREYGDLTGRTYFGDGLRSPNHRRWLAELTPSEKVAYWQDWLNRYPDHPGADDATDHLARSLLDAGDVMGATRLWISLMTHRIGDGDARFRGYPRVKALLDVGLSNNQIQELLQDPESVAIAPLLQYALAIHHARDQDYAGALQISAGLDLTHMSHLVLSPLSWETSLSDDFRGTYTAKELLSTRQQLQAMLVEQRQRWQQLLTWQRQGTSESRYQIASSWADISGWKNGYLPVWETYRRWDLPTFYDYTYKPASDSKARFERGDYDMDECRRMWVCDLSRRDPKTVQETYQHANSNAVAISLYQKLLDNPKTPGPIREKTLYMVGATLFWQQERFESGETQRIHPPAGVSVGPKIKRESGWNGAYVFPADHYLEFNIARDYQHRIDDLIAELQQKFPTSSYIDDLLIDNYFLSWEPRYLKQIVEQYPKGDRAQEANFLLTHPVANMVGN
jgi:hypothetical protein